MWAQSLDIIYKLKNKAEFEEYKSTQRRLFNEYRDRVNSEFADYMRQMWPEYKSQPAVPVPDSPEPVVKEPDRQPSNDRIPFVKVEPVPRPVEPPTPVVPIPEPVVKPSSEFQFDFYGAKCKVPLEAKHRFTLSGVNENSVADGWKILSADDYLPVVAACIYYRDRLDLCDWGYVKLVEKMTTAFFPQSQLNEARLMQMYILTQSGYKVRIARAGDRLALLLPCKDMLYQYAWLTVDGVQYYLLDKSLGNVSLKVFNREFPKEKTFSIRMSQLPALPVVEAEPRQLCSKHNPETAAEVSVNRNLIDFYNDYPMTNQWNLYSSISLSPMAKEQLYPALKKAIEGKDRHEAANILLRYVQTAFDYKTDQDQFGYERPLFADETLFYPYCDCEDRAILYSILVRNLLGLDVVLLHYPKHLATAVCFNSDYQGDHLDIDGKRYIVCDPTYINASIGQAMPQFKQLPATVLKIK